MPNRKKAIRIVQEIKRDVAWLETQSGAVDVVSIARVNLRLVRLLIELREERLELDPEMPPEATKAFDVIAGYAWQRARETSAYLERVRAIIERLHRDA